MINCSVIGLDGYVGCTFPLIYTLDPPMPFIFLWQRWNTLNCITSFIMMLLAPVLRTYEVLSVSAMNMNGIDVSFFQDRHRQQ